MKELNESSKLRCYEVTKTKVNKMVYDQFENYKYLPNREKFKNLKKEVWLVIKDKILKNKDNSVKTYKGLRYYPINTTQSGTLLIFVMGKEAEPLLNEIYTEEIKKVENIESSNETSTNTTQGYIDLEDNTIPLDTKIKALLDADNYQFKGRLNPEDTYKYLHYMIGETIINEYKKSESNQEKFFQEFAKKLKINKEIIDNYLCMDTKEIAGYLKAANEESKTNKDFYKEVMS